MDYVFPSSNNETMLVSSNKEPNHENLNSNHDQDTSLFGQFPLPSLDEISTSGILQNHHHHHHLTSNRSKTTTSIHENEPPPSPGKTKRVRKKRSAGKKDRHSKIHTAQGLRDRRMRLSLHIARKFFGLQDMLGFDKASKTIDWLFCKSKKAIEEVTECHKSRSTTQSHVISKENIESCQSPLSDCVADSDIDYDAASNKGKQLKIQDHENSVKPTESDILARESRDKARARARERTRERMMINNLEKSKQMFGENPNDNFDHPQLGFAVNPNNHYNIGESSSSLEYSATHHFFDQQAQLDGIAQKTENYLGTTTAASSSSYFSGFGYNKYFANPPAGWLNSSNTFLGFLGGWDSDNFRMESENYGNMSNIASSTGDIHEQIVPHTNLHFQSQPQRD